jgi:hypothetical protein
MSDWTALFGQGLMLFLLMSLLTTAFSLAAVGYLIVNLPASYLCDREAADVPKGAGIHWWAGRIAKNLLGAAVVTLGVVMAVPGVPGPGLLVLLVGIMLTDLPRKRQLERRLVGLPGVLPAVNRLRAFHGRPPIFLP